MMAKFLAIIFQAFPFVVFPDKLLKLIELTKQYNSPTSI